MAIIKIHDAAGFGFGADIADLFEEEPDPSKMSYAELSGDRARMTVELDSGYEFEIIASSVSTSPIIRFIEISDDGSPIVTMSGLQVPVGDGSAFDSIDGPDELIGNKYADIIHGEGGNDILRGNGGNDKLFGNSGADRLLGGQEADRLVGGMGRDRLDAGLDSSADLIVLRSARESAVGATHDTVLQFDRGEDHIDLSRIDTRPGGADNAFAWGGHQRTDHGVWWTATAGGVLLQGDLGGDGDTRPDFEILISGLSSLGRDDILL